MPAIDLNTVRDQVKVPQFVAEGSTVAAYGVTPTNPAFLPCGRDAVLIEEIAPTTSDLREAGSGNRKETTKTREENFVRLKFKLTLDSEGILAWGMNDPVAAGTPAESRTFFWSRFLVTTETFIQYKGCKPVTCTLNDDNVNFLEVDLLMTFKTVTEDTAGPTIGAGSYATPSAQVPLTHIDGGSGKFVMGGTARELNGYSLTVNWEHGRQDESGSVVDLYREVTIKTVSGTVNLFKKESATQAGARAVTVFTGVLTIATASIVATFTDFILGPSSEEVRGDVSISTIESKPYSADNVAIA